MIGHVLLQPNVILKHLGSRIVNTKEFIQGDTATVKLLPTFLLSLGRHRSAASSKVDCVRQIYAVVSLWMWSIMSDVGRENDVAAFST